MYVCIPEKVDVISNDVIGSNHQVVLWDQILEPIIEYEFVKTEKILLNISPSLLLSHSSLSDKLS